MNKKDRRQQSTAAYHFSLTRLALNYYSFREELETAENMPQALLDSSRSFHEVLRSFLSGDDRSVEVGALRRRLSDQVEKLTIYGDCLQVYEYVFNRMERRFLTGAKIDISHDEIVGQLIEMILGSGSMHAANDMIQSILGQLPVCLTKNKFYSMVKEGLDTCQGAGKQNFDRLIYVMESSFLMLEPLDDSGEYSRLAGLIEELSHVDFKNMTAEIYKQETNQLFSVMAELQDNLTLCFCLMEMINDLYVLFLSKPEAMIDTVLESRAEAILGGILKLYSEGAAAPISREITDLLPALEGSQEKYMEMYLGYTPSKGGEDEEAADRDYLETIDRLLSGSLFADLEETLDSSTVDDVYIEKEAKALFARWDQLFKRLQKPVVRAIMARTLSVVPVFFNSIQEVEKYLRDSLDCCTDENEKETCMELLQGLMESRNALV